MYNYGAGRGVERPDSGVHVEDESRKRQLYTDKGVANPGYPGALLMLGVPLTLIGSLMFVVAILHGEAIGGAICACVAVIPGVMLILKSRRARRAQRRKAWECPRCGYDRRGLAAGGACPECGTVPTA